MIGQAGKSAADTQEPPKRKLVTLRRISQLKSIKRTRWEIASIRGWNVIVAKGQHTVGELVVYFEIDSFLPNSNARFWEYAASHASQQYNGVHGYVVRTIMRFDHIAQGLIFPLNTFPEINIDKREELRVVFKDDPGQVERAMMELDYAQLLGVQKFEQRFEDEDAKIYGSSPIFLPQPGCERAQNCVNLFPNFANERFIITEKLDGIPITIYSVEARSQWYKALPHDRDSQYTQRPRYGVCGRRVDYVEDDSLLWNTIRKQGIIEKMPRIAKHCVVTGWKRGGNNFAIQGEFCGEHILGNSMGFGPDQHHFYAFAIYDIDNQKWLLPEQTVEICKELNIDHAPVITKVKLEDFGQNVKELLKKAEGTGVLGNNREGIVFRTLDNSFSFKAIANSWLLEYGHQKITPDQW